MRKERLVPDRRIRRGFRWEPALNEGLKQGRNKKKRLSKMSGRTWMWEMPGMPEKWWVEPPSRREFVQSYKSPFALRMGAVSRLCVFDLTTNTCVDQKWSDATSQGPTEALAIQKRPAAESKVVRIYMRVWTWPLRGLAFYWMWGVK